MTPSLETGNAANAGAASRGWFVGDLAAWAASRGETFDPASTLRQRSELEVKWFVHPPRHERVGQRVVERGGAAGALSRLAA